MELFEKFVRINPKIDGLMSSCLHWLNEKEKAIRLEFILQFLSWEAESPQLFCALLDNLEGEEKTDKASELIDQSKAHQVLCRCLDILGSAAECWALKKLENWEREDFPLVVRCLGAAFPHPAADRIVTQIVNEPVFNFARLGKILMVPFFGNQAWERKTAAILKSWQSQNPLWMNSCLLSHKEKPKLTRLACAGLLANWEGLVIRQKKRSPFLLPGQLGGAEKV